MTVEQLEELMGKVMQIKAAETHEQIMKAFPGPPIVEYLCRENAHLTRRVLAAEKLVEVSANILKEYHEYCDTYIDGMSELDAALTAYREACK